MLIDTNIAIALRDGDTALPCYLVIAGNSLQLSLASLVELRGGQYARPDLIEFRTDGLERLLRSVTIVPLDQEVVSRYAEIVQVRGFPVPASWIA